MNTIPYLSLLEDRIFVLEGILGIGLKGQLSSFLKTVVDTINEFAKTVVSCDIPSGLCPETGNSLPVAVKADYTVTFIAPKDGFFKNQGQSLCGKIFVVDIGVSKELLGKTD